MKKIFPLFLVLVLLPACGGRTVKKAQPNIQNERLGNLSNDSTIVSTTGISAIEEIPCVLYDLPNKNSIDLKWQEPSTIDLNGINDNVTWFYTPDLSDAFGYSDEPGYLNVICNDEILSAQLIINYYPTIWSDEKDYVIQLIEFPKLKSVGTKSVFVDHGRVLQLNREDLFTLPDNVIKQIAEITQQDLLSELESAGTDYEFENWTAEKKVWKRYIGKYHPSDFIKEQDNNRFGTYPNTFYLQLTFKGKNSNYIVNICDMVIIGN